MVHVIKLEEEIKCPGCNWNTTELYVRALTLDAVKGELKQGLGCCADCHAGEHSVVVPQEKIELEFKAFKKHHGIE